MTVKVTAALFAEPRAPDPLETDTTVRVGFDDTAVADSPASPTDFQPFDAFDIVIPAGKTSAAGQFSFLAVDDRIDEDDETVTLRGVVSADAGREVASVPVSSTSITITDDDTRGVEIPVFSLLADEGQSSPYTVVLESQPTGEVTIAVNGVHVVDVINGVPVYGRKPFLVPNPTSLTFTEDNWDKPQAINVFVLDDGTLKPIYTVETISSTRSPAVTTMMWPRGR